MSIRKNIALFVATATCALVPITYVAHITDSTEALKNATINLVRHPIKNFKEAMADEPYVTSGVWTPEQIEVAEDNGVDCTSKRQELLDLQKQIMEDKSVSDDLRKMYGLPTRAQEAKRGQLATSKKPSSTAPVCGR